MASIDDALAIVGLMCVLKENRRKRKKRELWCKHWLLLRKSYSHTSLINELRITPKDFNNYLRMNEDTYLHLLSLVTPLIKRQDTILHYIHLLLYYDNPCSLFSITKAPIGIVV